MRRCLELAEQGRGKVSPNPLVGCVITHNGEIVAEGWHEALGARHAEKIALEKAGAKARGSTLYVNLEPCCRAGRQPPCTEAILAAGITRVVFGAADPSNAGGDILRARGVEVIGGVLAAESRRLNRGFLSVQEQGRPWVTLKCAQTRDGKIPSSHITSEDQDRWTHTHLRAMHDAILVGSGTVIADNPQLSVRYSLTPNTYHLSPRRIILDPHHEIPSTARVLTDSDASRTLVIREKLPIAELLQRLLGEGITSILVEGGTRVWKAFEESGCIDETVILRRQ